MTALVIEYRPIEALIPYANNARTHSEQQIDLIAASIKEFGWTNPVLVDGDNGVIAGHGRILAARKMGQTSIPCLELSSLSEAQKRAYVITDNKIALNADWDDDILRSELKELVQSDFDVSLLGFDSKELNDLLEDFHYKDDSPAAVDEKKYLLMIEYDNEVALERAYNDANAKGLRCKIIE